MGKTLTNVLIVAAAIAVNVIPGVGQVLSAAIGATLATAVVSSITLYGLQSAFSLLGLGGGGPKPETTEQAIKTSRPPRVSAYGRSRLYGAYNLFETASNGTAVDVYAVHHGQLDAIEAHYLGDEAVTLTGNTVNAGADGRYGGSAVKVYATDGSAPGAGFPAVEALLPGIWGPGHRGDGVVALALTAASVKAKDFQKTYPASTVPVPSIVARWQKCPDADDATPWDESGWTWTENPWRQLLHYKMVREGPKSALPRDDAGWPADILALRETWWNYRIAPTLEYWQAAIANADEPVALKAGGTEPRYRSEVVHKHIDDHKAVVSGLLSTCDGWIAPRADGAFVVYSGAYYEPDVDDLIGPDEIVSYTWDGGAVDDDQAVNEIICAYVSAAHDYNTVECDAWRDEPDIAERGKILSAPLEAQIPSPGQSRRLAKRRMARANAVNRGTVTTNIAGRKARGKRYIPLRLEEAGTVFYDGPVEITALTRNLTGGVTFSWVAADPNVDNWNPAAEEGEPAALGPRVPVDPLDTPVIDDAAAVYDAGSVRLQLAVTGPDRVDLTWFVHWRVLGATVWGPDLAYTDTDTGASVLLLTGPVPAETEIEIQVAYQIGDGRYSDWSVASTVDTSSVAMTFDFTGGALPADATLTRASGGRYWNGAGVLALAAADAARFDHDASGALRGLLLEPARTNLALHTDDFTEAGWIVFTTAKTTGQADPAGGAGAVLVTADGTSNFHIFTGNAATIVNGQTYTFSTLVDPGTAAFLQLSPRPDSFDPAIYANFSFAGEGSVTAAIGLTATIRRVNGGFYLLTLTATANASGAATNRLVFLNIGSGSAPKSEINTSAETYTVFGVQIEAGDTATSYIQTSGAAVARSADVLTLDFGARGASDGGATIRYTFDDGSTQDVADVVSGGEIVVPTNLNRPWITSARKL